MIINGSDINLPALKDVKSLGDLKKLNIFIHLSNESEANIDLWKIISGSKSKIPEPDRIEDLPDNGNE